MLKQFKKRTVTMKSSKMIKKQSVASLVEKYSTIWREKTKKSRTILVNVDRTFGNQVLGHD